MEEKIKVMLKMMKKVARVDCDGVDCDKCPLLMKNGDCYRNIMDESRIAYKKKRK
jgi:hypothetical protein